MRKSAWKYFVWASWLVLFGLLAGCQAEQAATPPAPALEVTAAETLAAVEPTAPPSSTVAMTATSAGEATDIPPQLTSTPTPPATASNTPTSLPIITPTPPPTPTTTPVIEAAGAILPPGFSMIRYADMARPTGLAFDQSGRLYATAQDGTVHLFIDEDGDGRADVDSLFFRGFNTPLGITVRPGTDDVYVSSNSRISILRDRDGDLVAEEALNFVRDLPVGRHQNDNLKFGPDGLLYIGVGSTCDACQESDPRSATIMRFDPNTGQGEIFATGLRNPYDLAFHPLTGDLFATDNGRDDLGLDAPQEELNHIVQGGDYGFPDCWNEGEGTDCDGTITAVAFFEPHSSANSLDFYSGDGFPSDYKNNAFVAIFGSWLKRVQTGIVRVELVGNGSNYQSRVSWFVTWPAAMPLGLIEGPDGALYIGDYINGGIYRISYGS